MHELKLLEEFLKLPHSELHSLSAEIGDSSFKVAEFERLAPPGNFVALMPQWDFLNFLAEQERRFSCLKVMMSAEVTGLMQADGRVAGANVGDAAHAMSPIGGVGINLAIQDAVATANILAAKLKAGAYSDDDLDAIRRRRLFPVKVVQGFQVAIQNRVLKPRMSGQAVELKAPWPLKLLNASAWARRWPAQFLGVGVRPEHVRSPSVAWSSCPPHA